MKAESVVTIRKELKFKSPDELAKLCLRLARFKKENKELLTYLLFEAENEEGYVQSIKNDMDDQFADINYKNFYYIKKSIRKILRNTKKFIRYSNSKETEVALLLYFCLKLKNFKPSIQRNQALSNLYDRQLAMAKKKIDGLHEDLQYDYRLELEDL